MGAGVIAEVVPYMPSMFECLSLSMVPYALTLSLLGMALMTPDHCTAGPEHCVRVVSAPISCQPLGMTPIKK